MGDLAIELDGTVVDPPASKRARALLGLLVVDRRMHSRSSLAARFWPDVLDESARTSLRSALAALRRALGPESERYVLATRDGVGLADASLVWTDVAEFERCVEEGRLEDALALARGELLPGLDDDWVYERRDAHRDRVAEVLGQLAADADQEGDLQAAIEHTRRQVALDPLAEEPQRNLMRRLAAAGDRAAALRVYERLSRRLRDELRLAPAHETRELAESLRGREDAVTPEAQAAAPELAQSIVTLLFTDLVGSTALLSELGDDRGEQLRRIHFGLLRDVASAHSGEEVKNLGDGLMVAFPSVVNAVGCAVGIQQAVHRHNTREGDERLQVRVGLHVGEPIRDEGDYFGTPVVIAKRLCDKANAGQVLASELVRGLVGSRGDFDFHACGALELKGITEPLPAVEVGWEPVEEKRISLPRPLVVDESAPLIGRQAQLEELNRHWESARDGRRQVAMLVGEPGIGKTRLATEFCRTAYEAGGLVLLGRCYEDSMVPYQSLVEALRHYVSESSPDALRISVGSHRATLAKLLPELAESTTQRPAGSAGEQPEREQFMLFDAVASLLRAAAEEQPMILVLDDLHWAGVPTLTLLRHVVRATEGAPLLILGTFRETEVDDAHPLAQALAEMRRARSLESLRLEGLGEDDVATMISARSGSVPGSEVTRGIVDRTQGNPFFVEELLRQVTAGEDFDEALTQIPDSVKDLLLRRLSRLDEDATRLLTFAAVSGRAFELDVLAQVSDAPADQVAEVLEQAIGAHIVVESGSVGHYSFAHALIRETIYEQLSRTRRAQLHRMIGEAIESVSGEDAADRASALAYHFSAAGDAAKAYEYNARAAAAASEVYAIEPALAHYTAALDAAAQLRLAPDSEPALRRLLIERGGMRFRTGDFAGSGADFEAALQSAQRAGDRELEMEALDGLGYLQIPSDLEAAAALHESAMEIARELGDAAAETNALDRLSVLASQSLDFARGLELGERALERAREVGDEVSKGRGLDSIKLAAWQLGDLPRLEELTTRLEALWRERGDLWYLQWTLLESAFVPIGRAQWAEAAKRLDAALAVNRRTRDPAARVLMLDAQCWLHRSRGAYDEALSAGRRAMELSGETPWPGWIAATLGWTLLDLRATDAAAEVLERGLRLAEGVGRPSELTRCLAQLGWARLLLGAEEEARALTARAQELLDRATGGVFLFGAHAYAAAARVLLETGEPERGAALLRPVLAAAERFGWLEAQASSALVLGLCLESRGNLDEAHGLLTRAASIADEHGIPGCGWEAHAALARVGDQSAEHAAASEALVERIAQALSDDRLRAQFRERAKP